MANSKFFFFKFGFDNFFGSTPLINIGLLDLINEAKIGKTIKNITANSIVPTKWRVNFKLLYSFTKFHHGIFMQYELIGSPGSSKIQVWSTI